MLQYEGCVVPLKLLLVGVLHNDENMLTRVFCKINFSLMYFLIQSEASV